MTTRQHDQAWRARKLAVAATHPKWGRLLREHGQIVEEQILAVVWLMEVAQGAGWDEKGRYQLVSRFAVVYEGSRTLTPWQAAEQVWREAQGAGVGDA